MSTTVATPLLLAAGADPGARSEQGNFPLHLNPQPALLAPGVNVRNDFGMTPLHYAALDGSIEAVNWLLAQGADPALETTRMFPYKERVLADEWDPVLEFKAGSRAYDFAHQQFDRTKWSTGKYRPVYEKLDAVTPRKGLLRR